MVESQKTKTIRPRIIKTVVLSRRKIEAVFSGCGHLPETEREIRELVDAASRAAGASVIGVSSVEYPPSADCAHNGLTGVAILGESHAVIATWPEYDAVEFSISTCGEKAVPDKAVEYLRARLKPIAVKVLHGGESIAALFEKCP